MNATTNRLFKQIWRNPPGDPPDGEETIQKALRMVDESSLGFDPIRFDLELNRRNVKPADMDAELKKETRGSWWVFLAVWWARIIWVSKCE